MTHIINVPPPSALAPGITASAHQIGPTRLALGERVSTGVPVKPGRGGWVVDKTGWEAWGFADRGAQGGDTIVVWRSVTLELYVGAWGVGDRVGVEDVDDLGRLRLKADPNGPFVAITPTSIAMFATGPLACAQPAEVVPFPADAVAS